MEQKKERCGSRLMKRAVKLTAATSTVAVLALASPIVSAQSPFGSAQSPQLTALDALLAAVSALSTQVTQLVASVGQLSGNFASVANPPALVTPAMFVGSSQDPFCVVTNIGPSTATVTANLIGVTGQPYGSHSPLRLAPGATGYFGGSAPSLPFYCRFEADVPTSQLRAEMSLTNRDGSLVSPTVAVVEAK